MPTAQLIQFRSRAPDRSVAARPYPRPIRCAICLVVPAGRLVSGRRPGRAAPADRAIRR